MQFQKTKPRKIKDILELKIPKSEKVFLDEIDAVCDSINAPVLSQHNWINLVKILNSAAEIAIPEKTEKVTSNFGMMIQFWWNCIKNVN